MSRLTKKNTTTPSSIELLFNNEKLDLMKTLCLLYVFLLNNKKRRKVSEIIFYYCLVNFDLIKLFEKEDGVSYNFFPSPNLYFRFESKINGILLNMSYLKFVNIHGDLTNKIDDITVQLTSTGKDFFETIQSDYYSNLLLEYINVIDRIKFTTENIRIIKGVQ